MLTEIIMILIVLFLGSMWLFQDKKGKTTTFFDKSATGSMRGFWCLVILLVHVPKNFQNPIQDLIGSFAYIGVTFFFMTSGYGLMLSVYKNPQIVKQSFWRKRLPKLLLPMFFVNVISVIVDLITTCNFKILNLFLITGWVRQLLLFYLVFWLVFSFLGKNVSLKNKSYIVCAVITAFSILFYFTKGKLGFAWPTESFGFVYGILFSHTKEKFEKFATAKWWLNSSISLILSFVLGVLYLKFKYITFLGDYVVKILLGLCILIFIMFINTKISVGNAVNRFLGDISYEIYLIHTVSFGILKALPIKINSGVFVLSSILITIILSLIVKFSVEFVLNSLSSIKGVKNVKKA